MALLNLSDDESTVDRIITNLKLDYDLPVDGLIATVNAGYDNSKGEGFSSQDKNMPTDAVGFNGSNNMYSNESTNLLFDAYLNYALESGKSNLSVTAGHSYQSFEYDNSSTASVEYLNTDGSVNNGSSTTNSYIDTSKNVLLSYFGRINYSFNEKYLLTATLRADASSKLPANDRWGQFFSAALAWNFYDDGVDKLKLRVSMFLRLTPSILTVPLVGSYNRAIKFNRDVLPPPVFPRMATVSPFSTVKLMLFNAVMSVSS